LARTLSFVSGTKVTTRPGDLHERRRFAQNALAALDHLAGGGKGNDLHRGQHLARLDRLVIRHRRYGQRFVELIDGI
jgi:hypothetical protein